MDDGLLWRALEAVGALLLAIGGWIMSILHSDVKSLKESQGACEIELQKFKTDVANTYAKEATMQQSLGRIHDRIDDVANDIKQILQRVK